MHKALEIALSQYGIREIVGDTHNGDVLKYFEEIGHSWVHDDEMAWCSAFVNWCAMKAGHEYTGKLNARSWLDIGEYVEDPFMGCIVVLWRIKPDSPYGHVGFYIREDANYIYILGGNQKNRVQISAYSKSHFLGYRKLNNI